jgi:hypothetical protein
LGEGGSEVEWVRAVSYFLELRPAVSVEGSDNEGLPAFIEEQNFTEHTSRVKCVHPSERCPGHGVIEMIAPLHPGRKHAARERAFATVGSWVGDCSHSLSGSSSTTEINYDNRIRLVITLLFAAMAGVQNLQAASTNRP